MYIKSEVGASANSYPPPPPHRYTRHPQPLLYHPVRYSFLSFYTYYSVAPRSSVLRMNSTWLQLREISFYFSAQLPAIRTYPNECGFSSTTKIYLLFMRRYSSWFQRLPNFDFVTRISTISSHFIFALQIFSLIRKLKSTLTSRINERNKTRRRQEKLIIL